MKATSDYLNQEPRTEAQARAQAARKPLTTIDLWDLHRALGVAIEKEAMDYSMRDHRYDDGKESQARYKRYTALRRRVEQMMQE